MPGRNNSDTQQDDTVWVKRINGRLVKTTAWVAERMVATGRANRPTSKEVESVEEALAKRSEDNNKETN